MPPLPRCTPAALGPYLIGAMLALPLVAATAAVDVATRPFGNGR